MKLWVIAVAVGSYLISGLNPAIIFSKLIYHEDIRETQKGSGNPGFTNFKRVYGMKYAWLVLLIDVLKAIVIELIAGGIFANIFSQDYRISGIAFSGIFAMIGHAYPVWYKFKGGKAFLVCISTLFLINWKAGLFATVLLTVLLLATKYMSLSTLIALTAGAVVLPFWGTSLVPSVLFALGVLLVIFRHKENIKRLIHGLEPEFSFFTKSN